MKTITRSWTQRFLFAMVPLACLAATRLAQASINNPYTPDANTVLLLHLDEAAPSAIAANAVVGGVPFVATANPSAASPRDPTAGLLGATGASGVGYDFGRCANLTFSNSVGLFMDNNLNGVADLDVSGTVLGADAIAMSTLAGPSGEFTLEALVKLPSLTGANREIICMDTSGSPRPFQFRFTATGQLEFNNIGTTGANPKVSLPTTGPEAFVANEWFHVALTYDGLGNLSFYWTKLDNARTGATLLQTFTDVPALNETGSAVLTLGNESRAASGEGLLSYIDEVRISNVARSATDMIFNTQAPPIPPTISPQPVDQFLGVGETLAIQSHASGSVPLTYQWQKSDGTTWSNLPGQTTDSLALPVTFAVAGDYRYVVANNYGSITSSVARVTVGAVFSSLFPTGFDDTRTQLEDGAVDPHYLLWTSADANTLGPDLFVLTSTADYSGNDANSKWIAPAATLGSVRGVYVYRTSFLLDSAAPEGAVLEGSTLSGGSLTVLLNGNATGAANLTPAFPGPHRNLFSFTITNGFVAGVNTLDFVVDNATTAPNAPAGTAVRITSLRGVGQALPAGLPTVTNPQSQTVKEAGQVTFSVVASGRPPLRYQWYADGAALAGATNRQLRLSPVYTGGQGSRFHVVVSNDSGSATSQAATLTLTPLNQPVVVTPLSVAGFVDIPVTIPLSDLIHSAQDPDGDPVFLASFDATGTNTASPATITAEGASLVYANQAGFVGRDSFTVMMTDGLDATINVVNVTVSPLKLQVGRGPANTVRLAWPAAATAQGYSLRSGDLITTPLTNAVTENVVTEGADSAVYVTPTTSARFFRLMSASGGGGQ